MSSCNTKFLKNDKINEIYDNSSNNFYTHIEIVNCDSSKRNIKKIKLNLMDNSTTINKYLIEREYNSKQQLFTQPDEAPNKVAYHVSFELLDNYKGKDIAKDIHKKELEVYLAEGIKEIQLHAWKDGIIVWLKLGYNFMTKDSLHIIAEGLMNYLETIKNLPDEQLDEIHNILFENGPLTEEVLRNIDSSLYKDTTLNFTSWYENNFPTEINWEHFDDYYPSLGMYKEVKDD